MLSSVDTRIKIFYNIKIACVFKIYVNASCNNPVSINFSRIHLASISKHLLCTRLPSQHWGRSLEDNVRWPLGAGFKGTLPKTNGLVICTYMHIDVSPFNISWNTSINTVLPACMVVYFDFYHFSLYLSLSASLFTVFRDIAGEETGTHTQTFLNGFNSP